jgi:hypothetical protein
VKVPNDFYHSFRWKNSLLAFATGVLLGVLSLRLPLFFVLQSPHRLLLYLISWGVAAVVIYQFAVQKYFAGPWRGEFEYAYLESLIKQRTKETLKSVHANLSDREALHFDPTAINSSLLKAAQEEHDSERKFLLLLTLAVQCAKADENSKVIEYSKEAAALKPDDLVTNFILAEALERKGAGSEAVQGYEAALRDPAAQSPPLKELITAQITRVKTVGPRKGSKVQGLRYMTW